MAAVCSVTFPARAQAVSRRVAVRNTSATVQANVSTRHRNAFVGTPAVLHRRASAVGNKANARGFAVVANAAPPAGDALPPPAVFNVSATERSFNAVAGLYSSPLLRR